MRHRKRSQGDTDSYSAPTEDLNPNTPEALARIVYRCLTVMEYGLPELEADLVDFLRKE